MAVPGWSHPPTSVSSQNHRHSAPFPTRRPWLPPGAGGLEREAGRANHATPEIARPGSDGLHPYDVRPFPLETRETINERPELSRQTSCALAAADSSVSTRQWPPDPRCRVPEEGTYRTVDALPLLPPPCSTNQWALFSRKQRLGNDEKEKTWMRRCQGNVSFRPATKSRRQTCQALSALTRRLRTSMRAVCPRNTNTNTPVATSLERSPGLTSALDWVPMARVNTSPAPEGRRCTRTTPEG